MNPRWMGATSTIVQDLVGIEFPIIQAPMAGVQGSTLAVAVSNAGGLGSLPCAMLGRDAMRKELTAIRSQTTKPFNVNFFCHTQPEPNVERETAWRAALAPYFAEYGIDASAITAGPARAPFSAETADVLSEFTPPVVSFHFGLPSAELLAQRTEPGVRRFCPRRLPSMKHFGWKHAVSTLSLPKGSRRAATAACSSRKTLALSLAPLHWCHRWYGR